MARSSRYHECRESGGVRSHVKVQAATSAKCISSNSSKQSPTSSPQYQEHPRPASVLRTLSSIRLACQSTRISFRVPVASSLHETPRITIPPIRLIAGRFQTHLINVLIFTQSTSYSFFKASFICLLLALTSQMNTKVLFSSIFFIALSVLSG